MKKLTAVLAALIMLVSVLALAGAEDAPMKLSAPAGAPALAVATLAAENPENYTFVAADTIAAEFQKNEADFIIAPINAGAKLYKGGKSTYRLAAVVTWGNLFIASQKENFSLEDLRGGKITLFGENTINASVVLASLKAAGYEPEVEYLAGAANTQALLMEDGNAIVVTAEPALTAAKMKNSGITAYPVNELLKKATGFDGYTQAGLFVREKTAQERPDAVRAYLAGVEEAAGKCESDIPAVAEAAVKLEILPNAKVAEKAIPGCAIRFLSAKEAREQVEATANLDLSQFGGVLPADDFYYGAE